jgi:DNA-binding transcriptional MocR family regulator
LRRFRRRAKEQVAEIREHLLECFPPGTTAKIPEGGHVLWVKLPDACSATDLAVRASRGGIQITPGPLFSPHGDFRNYIRVNCGFPLDIERRAVLARIAELTYEMLDDSLRSRQFLMQDP